MSMLMHASNQSFNIPTQNQVKFGVAGIVLFSFIITFFFKVYGLLSVLLVIPILPVIILAKVDIDKEVKPLEDNALKIDTAIKQMDELGIKPEFAILIERVLTLYHRYNMDNIIDVIDKHANTIQSLPADQINKYLNLLNSNDISNISNTLSLIQQFLNNNNINSVKEVIEFIKRNGLLATQNLANFSNELNTIIDKAKTVIRNDTIENILHKLSTIDDVTIESIKEMQGESITEFIETKRDKLMNVLNTLQMLSATKSIHINDITAENIKSIYDMLQNIAPNILHSGIALPSFISVNDLIEADNLISDIHMKFSIPREEIPLLLSAVYVPL